MQHCQIIPHPEVDHQIPMALAMLRPFFPRGLRELRVAPLEQSTEEGAQRFLAEWNQVSGYRVATIAVAKELAEEDAATIMQVLRHELVHAHMHQLDVFVEALIATCPGNRTRKATAEVYHMIRESIADDISYALGDIEATPREGQAIW